MTIPVVMAALISAIVWNLVTWFFGIPSSSSHALIGGFIGAAVTGFGPGVIQIDGLLKVLLALFISPLLGLGFGWVEFNSLDRRELNPQGQPVLLERSMAHFSYPGS
jgi:PiT family inorganic phosphate transporter